MNDFERINLERLKATSGKAQSVAQAVRQSAMQGLQTNAEKMARVLVWAYFDEGMTPAEVKTALRQDAHIFEGLNLTTIINDTYKTIQLNRESLNQGRFNQDSHRKFGEWFDRHRAG